MAQKPRIDLDGVSLSRVGGPPGTVAILRYRTREGLVLRMPESIDFLVEWRDIEDATIELHSGRMSIEFSAEYAARSNWLGTARCLTGQWMDRFNLSFDDISR